MDGKLFQAFSQIAYEQAGIQLKSGKEALVSARVAKRQRRLGIATAAQYLAYLEADETGDELAQFLDAISTNFTSFFREPEHFDLLADAAGRWLEQGQRRFRFWSAAGSTGEEPYSMAITLEEVFAGKRVDYKILATDISTKVLVSAVEGIYSEKHLRSVSRARRTRYFARCETPTGEEARFRIRSQLQSRLVFKRLNLAVSPLPMRGPLDAIFCRNVMIYFDREVRQRLIAEIDRLLAPGGLLMIGHSETLMGLHSGLLAIQPSLYRKPVEAT